MGKEGEPQPTPSHNDNILNIRCVGTSENAVIIYGRALTIPNNFTTGALKEILTGAVWDQGTRSFVYFPKNIEEDTPRVIHDYELKSLRDEERAHRLSQLDVYAMALKTSPLKMLVEEY